MQFILTTATAVQKIKIAAKAIANNSDISHTKALEQAAQEAGYVDWFHVQHCHKAHDKSGERAKPIPLSEQVKSYSQYLSTLSRAPVNVHKIKGPVFHEVSIEGHRFKSRVLLTGDIVIHKMHLLRPSMFKVKHPPDVPISLRALRKTLPDVTWDTSAKE